MTYVDIAAQRPAAEWPQWRGPQRSGVADFVAPSKWPATLTKKWEVSVGAGHSSPVVSGDRVIIHSRQGEREVTRAIDLKIGKEIWRNDYAAPYTMNPAARAHGPGPKSTPVIGELKRYTIADSAVWAHPAIAGNTILVKDVDKLICWNI